MPKKTSTQREADRLADFISLEPSQVADFRRNNPRFAPAKWWEYRPTDSKGQDLPQMQWQLTQEFLREEWDDGFELDLFGLTRLLLCVFDPTDTEAGIYNDRVRPAYAGLKDIADDFGYHIGLRYMAENPWAAKVCKEKECHRPFVADHAKRRYCFEMGADGLHCSERAIKRDHLKYYHEVGKEKRQSKNKKSSGRKKS